MIKASSGWCEPTPSIITPRQRREAGRLQMASSGKRPREDEEMDEVMGGGGADEVARLSLYGYNQDQESRIFLASCLMAAAFPIPIDMAGILIVRVPPVVRGVDG